MTRRKLRIATWNINRRNASALDALTDSRYLPDILTLQEVSREQADVFRRRLVAMGLHHVVYTGDPDTTTKCYGNVIASRWPAEANDPLGSQERFRWPQLVGHVVIEPGDAPVHIVTAHIPNGSGNGWAKIDAFRALAALVRKVKGRPCVLTGDFNEPQFALQDDRIVTFGQDRGPSGRYVCWRQWRFEGRSGTGEEWDAAVRWFFESRDDHGLRHAFWESSGHGTMAETHTSRGSPRWFDHVFVSDDFEVESCVYLHTEVDGDSRPRVFIVYP